MTALETPIFGSEAPAAGPATAGGQAEPDGSVEWSPSAVHAAPVWAGSASTLAEGECYRLWSNCVRRDPSPNVYLHPEVALVRQGGGGPALVHGHVGAEADAFSSVAVLAPKVVRTRLAAGLPWKASLRGRRLVGNQLLGGQSAEDFQALEDRVVEVLAGGAECVFVEDVEVGSPLWQCLGSAGGRKGVKNLYPGEPQEHWWIQFPDNAREYWAKFSGKTRYTLRTKAKKLPHTVRCFRRVEEVAEFLSLAHRVSQKSWQTKRLSLRILNSSEERAYFERVAALGAFRSYVLEHEGRPLSFLLGVQWGGRFVYEEVGYDTDFAKLAPGTVLFYRVLEDLIAHDTPRLLDFGFGHADYKELYANQKTMSGPVLLVRRALRPLTLVLLDRLSRRLSRDCRRVLRATRVGTALRRFYRS